jgi:hypothetical protein
VDDRERRGPRARDLHQPTAVNPRPGLSGLVRLAAAAGVAAAVVAATTRVVIG